MANTPFPRIGIFSKKEGAIIKETLKHLISFLEERKQHSIFFETETAALLDIPKGKDFSKNTFGQNCDLAIVIGGDGSLLKAGRAIVDHKYQF